MPMSTTRPRVTWVMRTRAFLAGPPTSTAAAPVAVHWAVGGRWAPNSTG